MSNNPLNPVEDMLIQSVMFGDDYRIEVVYHEQRDQVFEREQLIISRQINEGIDVAALNMQDEYDTIIDCLNTIIEAAYVRKRNPERSFSDPRRRRRLTEVEEDEE